ncbi:MAG: glucose-1-phosphate adenylyltransferase [Anaerolineaceae bacterium]|nr:glucose-1-phosphate adenylyltransferase [Anaerolineaceae bacterium]
MPSLDEVLTVILGGGRGSRLYPLTQQRSKPAVPIAGQYRLIDIPISNCINSGFYRIAVLTQFNSVSLHRHISRTYQFDTFHTGWVQIWAAEQTMQHTDWYQGTADAVRKQLFEIRSSRAKYVLILAGDHLYRMDYQKLIQSHWDNDADITVAVQPILKEEAGRFGILKREADNRIVNFAEKPQDEQLLELMKSRDDEKKPYLGSMGIYLFKTNVLIELLEEYDFEDFGGHVIPHAIGSHRVYGYDFDDYWMDIGTIRSFYETNLQLTEEESPFNFFEPQRPIYTRARYIPGSVIANSQLENVLLAQGCRIVDCRIEHSVIGLRSQIQSNTLIKDSIIMGSDYYEKNTDEMNVQIDTPLGIGRDCHIEGAIIDKNAHIGDGVKIKPFAKGTDFDSQQYVVRDGIVVVPKNTVLSDGMEIGPVD